MANILYKTTRKCNANCIYCFDKVNQFAHSQNLNKVMPIEDFKKMFRYICDHWGETDMEWCWHGGEPLMAGYEWFNEALFYMHVETLKHRIHIQHGMQTNGTLFDKKWQQLFDKYNVAYSISSDGMFTEQTRGYPEVQSTDYVGAAFKLGVITPLSSHYFIQNYEHVKKDPQVEYFTQNWVFPNEGYTPIDIWGSEEEIDAAIDRYIEFVNYWLYDTNHPLKDRNILDFIRVSLGVRPSTCSFINCFSSDLVCISPEGGVYKCDEIDNDDFYLGQYWEFDTYDDILNCPKLLEHIEKRSKWKTTYCKDCDFVKACGQGCWARASRESNGEHPYSFMCKLSKRLIPVLFEKLNDLTPEEFAKLNPHVKSQLVQCIYIPSSIKEEVIAYENNRIQTDTQM